MRTGMRLGWMAIALLVGMASTALALEVKPKALAHEMEGAKAYKLGEFRRAVDEFKAAYESPPPSGNSTPTPSTSPTPIAPTPISPASAKASPPLPPAAMSADVPSSATPSRLASRRWLWVAVGVAAAVAVGTAVGIGVAATQQSGPPGTDVGRVGVLP